MGTSISALLIISVLLTAVVVMFKANQIGAELLAVANKSTAEIIADRVSTKIKISRTVMKKRKNIISKTVKDVARYCQVSRGVEISQLPIPWIVTGSRPILKQKRL